MMQKYKSDDDDDNDNDERCDVDDRHDRTTGSALTTTYLMMSDQLDTNHH